jgi:hypothetical protein
MTERNIEVPEIYPVVNKMVYLELKIRPAPHTRTPEKANK